MKEQRNENDTGFARTLRWNLGEIIAQILVIPAVLVAAYAGFSHGSWGVFIGVLIPILGLVWAVANKLSGSNPYTPED